MVIDAKFLWDWASEQAQKSEREAELHTGDLVSVAHEMGKVLAYNAMLVKIATNQIEPSQAENHPQG